MIESFWNLVQHPYTEWVILGLNIVFLVLIIREDIRCWLFGIVASTLSVLVFLSPAVKLYSEALLYSVYVILGLYAWIHWHKSSTKGKMPVQTLSWVLHARYVTIGIAAWIILALFFMRLTDSEMPWADAFSTSFAFVATYLEAKKILRSWCYWIILHAFSIWLYLARYLNVMSLMMVGFVAFSILGLYQWSRSYKKQLATSTAD
jgi:nicotinamide mononucleotide transporter